jgi:cell division transport system permease protein
MADPSFFNRRSDLPLTGDATSRYLPWLIAPMVFLCAVALASAFILHGLITRWDRDVSGTLTVEVAAAPGDAAESLEPSRQRVEKVLALLQNTPGVANARALSQEQLIALLAPWLGTSDVLKDLPLPALIDVTVKEGANLDIDALARNVADTVPGASLDDHRRWLNRLIGLSRSIEYLAIGIVSLIGSITAATVYYATRTGMAIHRDVIDVLHLIGAPDGYIAEQFAHRAFILGLKGGVLGLLLTAPILGFIAFGAQQIEGGFLADLSLPLLGFVAVAMLPAVAALLAGLTARSAAFSALSRLL